MIFSNYISKLKVPKVKALTLSLDSARYTFFALAAIVLFLGIIYAYFVNQTVLAVVERKAIEEKRAELDAELAEIEFAYMEKKNAITLEYARTLGMTEVKSKKFVSRDTGTVLTLRN